MEDRSILFTFLPDAVFEVAEDDNARLGAVGSEVLISFNCHNTHGRDGFRHTFREAAETAIFLEGDLDIGVVGDEPFLFLHVGFVPC